jgi:hypothetical protein
VLSHITSVKNRLVLFVIGEHGTLVIDMKQKICTLVTDNC